MPRTHRSVLALIVIAATLSSACNFGQRAREDALAPILRSATDSGSKFRQNVMYGVQTMDPSGGSDAVQVTETFFNALASGNPAQVALEAIPLWPQVKDYAEAGIMARLQTTDGKMRIGANGAEVFRRTIQQIEEKLMLLQPPVN